MSQLRRLGDVCTFDKQQGLHEGLPYLGLEHIDSGTGCFSLSEANPDARSATFRFSEKHVLYGRLRPYLKKVALPAIEGRCSTEIFPILPSSDIDRHYLAYWLLSDSTTEAINATCTGARMPRANMDAVLELSLLVPGVKEQHRIVAFLDEAFAGIATAKANAEKNLQNARDLFGSEVATLFEELTTNHAMRPLGELCEKITVGYVGPMASRYVPSGIPFLRSQNIRPFRIDLRGLTHIDKEFHAEIAKSALRPGDVAVVRTGYPGTAAVIPDTLPDSNCSDLVIVRPSERLDPDFLTLFFNSDYGKRMVAGKLVGAAQKHFNVTAAKETLFPVLTKPEQVSVVEQCHALRNESQRLQSLHSRKLTALDELRQSLLQRAFSGQL